MTFVARREPATRTTVAPVLRAVFRRDRSRCRFELVVDVEGTQVEIWLPIPHRGEARMAYDSTIGDVLPAALRALADGADITTWFSDRQLALELVGGRWRVVRAVRGEIDDDAEVES